MCRYAAASDPAHPIIFLHVTSQISCLTSPRFHPHPHPQVQLRKWIKVYRSGAPQPPGVGVNAPDLYVLNHGVLNQGGWAVIAKLRDVNATLLHNAAVPPSRGVPIGWGSVPSPPLLAYTALPIMTCYGYLISG